MAAFATTEFANAGRAQADALDMPDFNFIFVEHPIQPLTDAEVHQRADAVYEQLLATLMQQPASSGALQEVAQLCAA